MVPSAARYSALPASAFHTSPTFSTRWGTVSMVNVAGSSFAVSSFHRSGVETVASGFALAEWENCGTQRVPYLSLKSP